MKTLRLASFGMRGFVGESLTPTAVMDFSAAFASFVDGGRVLLCRDTRYSSPMIHHAVLASLISAGCEVLDLGVCPTPMLQFAVPQYQAAGGLSITGAHSGMGWNSILLIGADGAFLEPMGGEKVLDLFHGGDFLKQDWQHLGRVRDVTDHSAAYFDVLQAHLDVAAIRAARFRVLIDPVGGSGCPFLAAFAEKLGFDLVPINGEPSGYLAREPEPRPRSAIQLAAFIRHVQGHVGFVLSSDMGRLSIVTEDGEPASEEYTFAIVADHVLGKRAGPVVTNCCTTRTIDDLAARHGVPLIKTRVGQAYILAELADAQGMVGGEGSGSAAWPAFGPAFDGFLMMGLILEAMAQTGRPVSKILRALPRYAIVKRNIPLGSQAAYQALEMVKRHALVTTAGSVDHTDGLRMDWPDGWVHVRPSRTQQIVRIISEARHRVMAEKRAEDMVRLLERER